MRRVIVCAIAGPLTVFAVRDKNVSSCARDTGSLPRLQRSLAAADTFLSMIWIFERGQEALRIETRVDNVTGDFIATVLWADGQSKEERFRAADAFRARLLALERQLAAEHWTQIGGPTLLEDGWHLGTAGVPPNINNPA